MKTVLVVGLSRSGTSLTCGVVKALGVKIEHSTPKEWQLRHNPKGNFESSGLIGLIEKINSRLQNLTTDNLSNLKDEFRNLVKMCQSELWGFKFPNRECLPHLLSLLPNPYIITVIRHPLDNAKSLSIFERENGLVEEPRDLNKVLCEICIAQNLLSQWLLQCPVPKLFLTFKDLRGQPTVEAKRIADFLGITPTPQMLQEVKDFVDDDIHTWKEEKGKLISLDPRRS